MKEARILAQGNTTLSSFIDGIFCTIASRHPSQCLFRALPSLQVIKWPGEFSGLLRASREAAFIVCFLFLDWLENPAMKVFTLHSIFLFRTTLSSASVFQPVFSSSPFRHPKHTWFSLAILSRLSIHRAANLRYIGSANEQSFDTPNVCAMLNYLCCWHPLAPDGLNGGHLTGSQWRCCTHAWLHFHSHPAHESL